MSDDVTYPKHHARPSEVEVGQRVSVVWAKLPAGSSLSLNSQIGTVVSLERAWSGGVEWNKKIRATLRQSGGECIEVWLETDTDRPAVDITIMEPAKPKREPGYYLVGGGRVPGIVWWDGTTVRLSPGGLATGLVESDLPDEPLHTYSPKTHVLVGVKGEHVIYGEGWDDALPLAAYARYVRSDNLSQSDRIRIANLLEYIAAGGAK